MAKTRDNKNEMVLELTDKLKKMKSVVFARISGFTMPHADELRRKTRENNLDAMVVKKTLLEIAAREAGLDIIKKQDLDGSILTVIGYDDEMSPAKTLVDFAKTHESVTVASGIMEGALISADTVNALAKLPGKDDMRGIFVRTIYAPVSGFANVLAANLRNLVGVLEAIKKVK